MLASLIPFFLVARMAVDESVWKYGPEYVFDVEVNVTSELNSEGMHTSNYMAVKLYCRPTGSDGLSCHQGKGKGQIVDLKTDERMDMPEEGMKEYLTEEPFEIRFNEHGVDHLIVNGRLDVNDVNNLKLIAERFNIGTDLNGMPDGTYDVPENTTIGHCNVTIAIKHYPSKRMMNKIKNNRYELESLPQLNKVPSETVMIQKTIQLDNCSSYACFYFGSYGKKVIEPDLHSHLGSATSRIFVSDYQFVSSVAWMGTVTTNDKKQLVLNKFVTLSLQDIRAAKRDLEKIPNAVKTPILANGEAESISAEE